MRMLVETETFADQSIEVTFWINLLNTAKATCVNPVAVHLFTFERDWCYLEILLANTIV